jgi:hypothetical protein
MFAFLLLLFVLLVTYYFTVSNEGFNPMNTSPSHVVNIPVPKIPAVLSPATGNLSGGKIQDTVKPSDMPGQLPHSQYDQIAASSPLPYQDTALIKANRQQMINLLEMLKGFLAFEAQEIAERSDPSIQLPLQTARSDFQSLQNEVQVLNRNPGIQPTITLSHLNDISSNLAYLQEKVRLTGASGPIQGPIYQFTKPVEGFLATNWETLIMSNRSLRQKKFNNPDWHPEVPNVPDDPDNPYGPDPDYPDDPDDSDSSKKPAPKSNSANGATQQAAKPAPRSNSTNGAAQQAQKQVPKPAPRNNTIVPANSSQPSVAPTSRTNSSAASVNGSNGSKPKQEMASLADLKAAVVRMDSESLNKSASGTSSPEVAASGVAIARGKSVFQELINSIENGDIPESDIKLTKKEVDGIYPETGNSSDPVPQLIQSLGLPSGMANMFPAYSQNDPASAREIGKLADKYLDTILNGISASFQVKYTAPREAEIAYQLSDVASMMSNTIVNGTRQKNAQQNGAKKNRSTIDKTGFPSAADLDNVSNAKFTPMDNGKKITDRMAPLPSDAGRGPSQFDWKQRAQQIESQIVKRGLNPKDFAVRDPKDKVSEGFSWKGYARMICNRLQTTTDPGLPETCGCPPLDWPGWRIAK